MSTKLDRVVIHRRALILGAGSCVLGVALAARGLEAAAESERSSAFEAAVKEIVGERSPEDGAITLELPEQADNGNIVPYKLAVESPMSEADYVQKLHLLSTANPNARVATFRFTPLSGTAGVTGRMRLAKTQDVVAIAETSTGRLFMATARVEVALGGCLN
jgi:sulfur-oxidizing protein SoxY